MNGRDTEFDFLTVPDRRGTGSEKWDVAPGELPMWIADMDFETAPAVREAIARRAAHGIYGYTGIPDAWADAYAGWWRDRHGLDVQREWLVFCTGVIPAVSSTVRKLTTPAEKVVVLTPVYNIFFNSILNNGRVPLECPLDFDPATLTYSLNFARLEACLADPQVSLLILCNPHNPIGKVWDRETLARIGSLCRAHGVVVLSDEIHCDLTAPGVSYVPFASVSADCRDNSVTCLAPTKAFNLAGIQTAAVLVPDAHLRHRVWRALNTDEVAEPNVFAIDAAIAAFTRGGGWLDALRVRIQSNRERVESFVRAEIPSLRVVPSEATYLLWLDCSAVSSDSAALAASLRARTGLYLSAGSVYRGNGSSFLRMNIACPPATLEDGLARLRAGIRGM